jgi:hypothetical protein
VLLRWMHLRNLVPIAELLEQVGSGPIGGGQIASGAAASRPSPPRLADGVQRPTATRQAVPAATAARPAPPVGGVKAAPVPTTPRPAAAPAEPTPPAAAPASGLASMPAAGSFKDAFLSEVRAGKGFFYNTVVAQAQRIDVTAEGVTFTFLPTHRALREQFEQSRAWLEQIAERVAGRKVPVAAVQAPAPAEVQGRTPADAASKAADAAPGPPKRDLKAEAMSSTAVQAMLDVFPAEIRDVEEM